MEVCFFTSTFGAGVFVWWETNTHGWEYRVRVFNGLIPRRATAARCNGVNGLRSVQISGCWLRTGRPPATWKPGNLHPPGQLDALPGAKSEDPPEIGFDQCLQGCRVAGFWRFLDR